MTSVHPLTSNGARRQRPSKRKTRKVRRSNPSPKPAAKSRRWLWLSLAAGVLVCAPLAVVLIWATRPGPGEARVIMTRFEGGESAQATATKLAELGLISHPWLFEIYLGWLSPSVSVQPGPHILRFGLNPRDLVRRLGRLPSRATVRVIVPEGFNRLQIAERLLEKEVCELGASAHNPALLRELGIPAATIEGYLFPATYELFVDSDPAHVIRQMVLETRKRLSRIDARLGGPMSRLAAERGFGEHEVLTLASLVEKEARLPGDRPLIASVFYNRLDDPDFRPARMLQSDATAAYGCAVAPASAPSCALFRGRVTPEMLRDAANPYNTYKHPGLPKGPIANPGESAIEAALAPAKTEYLFFVADGLGRHRFSRTFEEHRRSITSP